MSKAYHKLVFLETPYTPSSICPSLVFLTCFEKKTSRFMAGVFVFLGQESADREKVIPEKRKKLYGVSWSLSELSASRGGPRRH